MPSQIPEQCIKAKQFKIGILSDIHSNIDALKAIYAEFQRQKIDKIICLGDTIGIGPCSEDCVQFLLSIKDQIIINIRGNHEEYFFNQLPVHDHNDASNKQLPKAILDLFRWNHGQLSQSSIDFLSQTAKEQYLQVNGIRIYASHYPLDEQGEFQQFIMNPALKESQKLFYRKKAQVYLFGHTHTCCYSVSQHGNYYINPGSAGCPHDTNLANAGILTITGNQVDYQQLTVPYDVSAVIKSYLNYADQLPAINYTLSQFYGQA